MIFNSLHFLWFFAAVWLAYWALRAQRRLQNLLLLAASYFFYGYWDWRFLGLIAFSTIVDFACGLSLSRPDATARSRRSVLLISLGVNLGALGFFKYFNFFVESAQVLLAEMGLEASPATLQIILPVGISFYTFQTLSYTIDRYRGSIETERDFVDFAFFVSFFPQLVAGPIVRARDFLHQTKLERPFRWEDQALGLRLTLWGLFKKCVVADNLSSIVDATFASEAELGLATRVLAVYAFAGQIYCDFSGYTDIARGTARMLGFEFPWNFRMPYFAADPSTFWRKWHMTLSTWLRDYLYIPLGGNRYGPKRTYFNLMATMTLGGLWHGAAWNFVVWGVYQGLLLAVHRFYRNLRPAPENESTLAVLVKTVVFFQFVCLGWLFFRAQSLGQIVDFLSPTSAGPLAGLPLSETVASGLAIGAVGWVLVTIWDGFVHRDGEIETALEPLRPLPAALVCVALYLGVTLFGRFLGNDFIYFQF